MTTHVVQRGETFAVLDDDDNIRPDVHAAGLFDQGTRFLSCLIVHVDGEGVEHTRRTVVTRGGLHIAVGLRNSGDATADVHVAVELDADYADVFELRGMKRERRGDDMEPARGESSLVFGYLGLDEVQRYTHVRFDPVPANLDDRRAHFDWTMPPGGEQTLTIGVACSFDKPVGPPVFASALEAASSKPWSGAEVTTGNASFDRWLAQSLDDVQRMTADLPDTGLYPLAGVPWYATPFGRDGIITALELLWVEPKLARGVLAYLAAHQATVHDPERDSEPGKILHESRKGEMAALGEITPFEAYYGSADATPLFVMLAGAYLRATGDQQFIDTITPNLKAALRWIDAGGFIAYRPSPRGLTHQGWKDSSNAIFHADGQAPEGRIAVCEIQGYYYAALLAGAELFPEITEAWFERAAALKTRFDARYWREDIATYAIALDGLGDPCAVRSSNAGHCLYTGVVSESRAQQVVQTLMADSSFSGWGIRTIAEGEANYNPASYHNGSVWPHDSAIVGAGFARYGYKSQTRQVLEGLWAVSEHAPDARLPELFCGEARAGADSPRWYEGACAPQAWAAGAVFMLLGACLGLDVDAREQRITIHEPVLPNGIDWVRIRDLRVGDSLVAIEIRPDGVEILDNPGDVSVTSAQ